MKVTALLALVFLASCNSMRSYGPLEAGVGYASQEQGDGTIEVIYRGEPRSSLERVEDYCMLRCAEVTLEAGYAEFHLLQMRRELIHEGRWSEDLSARPSDPQAPERVVSIPTATATIAHGPTNVHEKVDAELLRKRLRERYRLDRKPWDDDENGFFIDR